MPYRRLYAGNIFTGVVPGLLRRGTAADPGGPHQLGPVDRLGARSPGEDAEEQSADVGNGSEAGPPVGELISRGGAMLVLARKAEQSLTIADHVGVEIVVTLVQVGQTTVRVGVDAPANVEILRTELVQEAGSNANQNTTETTAATARETVRG